MAREVLEFQLECSSPVQRSQAELRAQLGKVALSQTEEVGMAEMGALGGTWGNTIQNRVSSL